MNSGRRSAAAPTQALVLYDVPHPGLARITLARPERRNAQDTDLLYELNACFDRACADENVKVIVLCAQGNHFSAGHDLKETGYAENMARWRTVGTWCGFGCAGVEGQMAREKELYIGLSERWRNLPKVTIAQVQGRCVSGGLMLAWPCDLIVASTCTEFIDNTLDMGVGGAEFFAHPWELGARKAKEMLFTAGVVSAQEAYRLGMVNHVVPLEALDDFTTKLALSITKKPGFALKLAKEAVNAAQDAQGRVSAMQTAFALHQLAHAHNLAQFGQLIDPSALPIETSFQKAPT